MPKRSRARWPNRSRTAYKPHLTKIAMAEKMATSRSQLDRVLDPDNVSIQLDTLIKATRAVGKVVEIRIKRMPKEASA